MKSASKVPPLPRKISPTVYETFLEHSDAATGGKVLPGPGRWPPLPPAPMVTAISACRHPRCQQRMEIKG